jgi:hypothetical protein
MAEVSPRHIITKTHSILPNTVPAFSIPKFRSGTNQREVRGIGKGIEGVTKPQRSKKSAVRGRYSEDIKKINQMNGSDIFTLSLN